MKYQSINQLIKQPKNITQSDWWFTSLDINKKFELMLTRCTKAYSSFSLQIVLVYLQQFCHNSLLKCAPQPNIAKKQ